MRRENGNEGWKVGLVGLEKKNEGTKERRIKKRKEGENFSLLSPFLYILLLPPEPRRLNMSS